MIGSETKRNVAFLGTSLPRECGLATFSQDLIDEFATIPDFNPPRIIAVNDYEGYPYGSQVMAQIDRNERRDYVRVATAINHSNVDVLVIQHEFGIYGGDSGSYVLDFAENLRIPIVTIFHTVLPQPDNLQRQIMTRLAAISFKVVTMAQNTVCDLIAIYAIDASKIEVLHHGVPCVQTESRDLLKEGFGVADRQVLSTFGFLSPGKGIEYAIEAMSAVVKRHPDAIYLVWGKTHPAVKQATGEVYRQKLMDLVTTLGLDDHVKFVDRLLTKEEVIQSLVMCDIYLTPYLGRDQAVSGTLAYGIGCGRVIVSTSYRYAEEMLADGRGLLANFRDAASLEACVLELLDNPQHKLEMEKRTLVLGRTMMWSEIAKGYAEVFRAIMDARSDHHPSLIASLK